MLNNTKVRTQITLHFGNLLQEVDISIVDNSSRQVSGGTSFFLYGGSG